MESDEEHVHHGVIDRALDKILYKKEYEKKPEKDKKGKDKVCKHAWEWDETQTPHKVRCKYCGVYK